MRMKLAGALIAALMVFGLIFGVGQAAAASLPGGPLYGLKLTAEQARMELTSNPQARAELAAELAQNRLSEISQMVADGIEVDGETAFKAQQQVSLAWQFTRQISGDDRMQAQQRFAEMLANQHGAMASAVDAQPQQTQQSVGDLLDSMRRMRHQLYTGEGEASGQQNRTNWDAEPNVAGPNVEPDAGQQDADGLLDGSVPQDGEPGGQGVGPNYGPGLEGTGGAIGPYDGIGYGPGSDYGPGPAAPQDDVDDPGPFGWLWQLFKKEPKAGSGSSSGGSSGSSSSGSGSSGNGNR